MPEPRTTQVSGASATSTGRLSGTSRRHGCDDLLDGIGEDELLARPIHQRKCEALSGDAGENPVSTKPFGPVHHSTASCSGGIGCGSLTPMTWKRAMFE